MIISGIEIYPTATMNYILLTDVLIVRQFGTQLHFWMHIVGEYTTRHAPITQFDNMVPCYIRRFNDRRFFRRSRLSTLIQLVTSLRWYSTTRSLSTYCMRKTRITTCIFTITICYCSFVTWIYLLRFNFTFTYSNAAFKSLLSSFQTTCNSIVYRYILTNEMCI